MSRPGVDGQRATRGTAALGPFRHPALATMVWVTALVAAIALLHALGRGDLAAPPLHSADALRAWLAARGPVTGAFAVVRVGALVVAWYLAAVTVLGLVACAGRRKRLVHLVGALTVPSVRHLLVAVTGASLTTAVVVGAVLGPSRPASAVPTQAAPDAVDRSPVPGTATLSVYEDPEPPIPPAPPPPPSSAPAPAPAPAVPDLAPPSPDPPRPSTAPAPPSAPGPASEPVVESRTIRPGDHLWCLAEQRLAAAWGRPPTDAETVPYWGQVIDHNIPRLVDPDNPDLILVGQVIDLPPPPLAPAP